LLGAAFWVLGLPLAAAGVGGLVVGTVRWQALMNLILAIFNPAARRPAGLRANAAGDPVAPPRPPDQGRADG
jgi:hypothetical protein